MIKRMTTEDLNALKRRIRACWRRLPATDPRLCWLWDEIKAELALRSA